MKYLFIMTTSNNVMNFRRSLITDLLSRGNEVVVIAHDDNRKNEIEDLGVKFYCVNQDNRGISLLSIFSYKKKLCKIVKQELPDIVMTFQIKPNTFGVLASKKAKVKNIFSMVEGAGDVFIQNSFKWKIIRFFACKLYRKAFKNSKKVFFLNNDDKYEFIKRKLVKENQCEVVHGIGVDLKHFEQKPLKNFNQFIMVARMLKAKGVLEFCKCARIVKQKYPDAVFNYLGAEGTVKVEDIQEYIDDNSINYLGKTCDVRPFLENSSLFLLLSSYGEGLPMSIMEAEAVGRAIITSNSVGCKDSVIDGYNGFICEKYDYKSMAEKVMWCIEHPREVEEMGNNARKFAEENFDCNKINNYIISIINK